MSYLTSKGHREDFKCLCNICQKERVHDGPKSLSLLPYLYIGAKRVGSFNSVSNVK